MSGKEFDIYDDGWMFLLGGSNNVSDYWINCKSIGESIINQWEWLLNKRYEYCAALGIPYIHIVAPEKLSVYPEKCDHCIIDKFIPSYQIERSLSENLKNEVWINPISYFRKQKKRYQLYSKTDTHWNFIGAYSAYQLVQSKLGYKLNTSPLGSERSGHWTVMDLGGKLEPPLKEKVHFYKLSQNVIRVFANDIVSYKESNNRVNDVGLHVGSYVVYRNSVPLEDKVVVLFGDSFSEYRGHLLTGLLAETYREVHFIWNASMDLNLIEKINPDVVISELAERFMSESVPHNNFDHEEYSRSLIMKLIDG